MAINSLGNLSTFCGKLFSGYWLPFCYFCSLRAPVARQKIGIRATEARQKIGNNFASKLSISNNPFVEKKIWQCYQHAKFDIAITFSALNF